MKNTTMDDQTGRTKYVDIGGGRIAYMEVIRKLGGPATIVGQSFPFERELVALRKFALVKWWTLTYGELPLRSAEARMDCLAADDPTAATD
jgi:hypothetical protein